MTGTRTGKGTGDHESPVPAARTEPTEPVEPDGGWINTPAGDRIPRSDYQEA